jgi:MarR-like DNA-binding transcriptional regulator SgrR of sgrS sRNA
VRGRLAGPLRLSANAGHFAGRPFLDSITLVPYPRHRDEISAFYLARSLVSFQGTRLFGRAPDFPTRALQSPAVTTVALLVGRQGAVADRRVREAIYLAVDKGRLRQLVTGAPTSAAHGPVPPVLLGRSARWRARQPAPTSPARARVLLAATQGSPAVAARRSADGAVALALLVDRSRHRDMDIARKLMTDLAAVNLRVTITAVAPDVLARRRATRAFELALHRFTSPVLQSRYHLAAAYAAAGQPQLARRVVQDLHARVTARSRDFMRELPLIPLYHTGLRADVSTRILLRQGPWGLPDWAGAQLP